MTESLKSPNQAELLQVACPSCKATIGARCTFRFIDDADACHAARAVVACGGVSKYELTAEINELVGSGKISTEMTRDPATMRARTIQILKEAQSLARQGAS